MSDPNQDLVDVDLDCPENENGQDESLRNEAGYDSLNESSDQQSGLNLIASSMKISSSTSHDKTEDPVSMTGFRTQK